MFSYHLKKIRTSKGWSQAELAKYLGVTQQSVAKWEAGQAHPQPALLRQIADLLGVSTDYLFDMPPKPLSIPILGYVRGGFGAQAIEIPLGEVSLEPLDPELYFYLTVRGNSMEPFIHEGDLALVKRQNTLENGQLGVILYGDEEATLKVFYKNKSSVVLKPFHPDYKPLTISGKDLLNLRILGRVIETKTTW